MSPRPILHRLLAGASLAAVAFGCGWGARSLVHPSSPAAPEAEAPPAARPELADDHALRPGIRPSLPASAQQPSSLGESASCIEQSSRREVVARAIEYGCDCPIPPPDDIDPAYLPPAVEEWVDDLGASCPEFADREVILDCAEWPCLLMVKMSDRHEWLVPDLPGKLTCGAAGPELVGKGNAGAPGDFFHVFSVRPSDVHGYGRREMARTKDVMSAR